MSLATNLAHRARLVRVALTRRFIYTDIIDMAREYGAGITDVCGDLEPFALVGKITGRQEGVLQFPDFDLTAFNRETEAYTAGWSSEPSVSEFLGRLVAARRACTVIELGCFTGWSTIHMAHALKQTGAGKIHYLDYDSRFLAHATESLRRLGLDAWGEPLQGMSNDPAVLARLPTEADVVFIDTSHDYLPTLEEIALYGRRLTPNGCLVLHDSLSAPGVRRAVYESRERFHIHTFATERSNGLTVMFPRS
jgi:predicted O-methyltransferase YrrM